MKDERSDEAEELLRELADNPEEALRSLAGHALGPRSTKRREGLAAEELARFHAYECAVLLGKAATRSLYENPDWHGLLHRRVTDSTKLEIESQAQLAGSAGSLLAAEEGNRGSGLTLEDRHHVRAVQMGKASDALTLAAASRRIFKTAPSAIVAAHEYMGMGELESAALLCADVLDSNPSALYQSYALETMGAVMVRKGDPREAMEFFASASQSYRERSAPACSWFVLAVCIGDSGQAKEAGGQIKDREADEAVGAAGDSLSAFQRLHREGLFEAQVDSGLQLSALEVHPATNLILEALSEHPFGRGGARGPRRI